ncbi:ABC transporter ATP-binding protein [Streptomyces sp. NBC_00029]
MRLLAQRFRRRPQSASGPDGRAGPDGGDGGDGDSPVIELRGAGLTYPGPPPVEALRPCDLTVRRGEFITVVGPSGSGKSTFLNVAGLLDSPTSGRYLLDGIDTGALPDRERTALRGRRIGFVFQSFHLLPHRSALENVTLAMLYTGTPRAQRLVRAREALDQVGLGHRAGAVPGRLSGGERQRVAIARALVGRPSLLLCDEPTGNLDSVNAASVLTLLDELHGAGMTVLVITHDPQVARRGHRTLTIRDGRLHP